MLSLFSGVGAFESGLDRLGINYELVGFSEINKYAITSYCAIHNIDEDKNLGDVSKVEDLSRFKGEVDFVTGGSPCQDFSIAGKQQGSMFECRDCGSEFNPLTIHYTKRDCCPKCNSTNLEKTRSSLLIEYLRTIREIRPKYFIYENVKNIVGKRFKDAFDLFNAELQEYGYNTYYQVLNAKEYGIPQNRERIFVVGIRKDIDKGNFKFPKPFDNGLRLKDFLEDEVEDKYYINNERVDKLLAELKEKDLQIHNNSMVESENKMIQVNNPNHFSQRVCSKEDISPTISAGNNGGGKEPCKIICAERGRYDENGDIKQQLEIHGSGDTNALTTVQKDNLVLEPSVLRYERTEYGKEIRKQYENGEIEEKIGNMRKLKPRPDGVSNTLTTVQKDNLVLEPIICEQRTDEGLRFFKDNVCGTIRTIDAGGDKRILEKTNELLVAGNTVPSGHTAGRVFNTDGVSPTVMYRNSKVVQVLEENPNELQLFTNLEGGKWDKIHESARRVYEETGIAPIIPTCGGGNIEPKVHTKYKIRKLTPRECWRLMGFSDEDFERARQSLIDTHYNGSDRANSQLYKQAGNSIVVDVLVSIYRNLFKDYI